jgi:hypothetical protein
VAIGFELSLSEPDQSFSTSGSYNSMWAGSQDIFELLTGSFLMLNDLSASQGNFLGSATNYGAVLIVLSDPVSSMTGSWFGSDATWGTTGPPLENHDKLHETSDEFPNVSEGINVGDYNPFPAVVVPDEPPTKVRDLTRFKKAYSFSRNQPVRIRLIRK